MCTLDVWEQTYIRDTVSFHLITFKYIRSMVVGDGNYTFRRDYLSRYCQGCGNHASVTQLIRFNDDMNALMDSVLLADVVIKAGYSVGE